MEAIKPPTKKDKKMNSSKYGYCIATTPGLIQDGTFPLSATRCGLEGGDKIAVWPTRKEAEEAIKALVHRETDGAREDAAYGAYSVQPVWEIAPNEAAYDLLARQ